MDERLGRPMRMRVICNEDFRLVAYEKVGAHNRPIIVLTVCPTVCPPLAQPLANGDRDLSVRSGPLEAIPLESTVSDTH